MKDNIVLYPSNWLYNASVIGFLKSLDMMKKAKKENIKDDVEGFLQSDGTVHLPRYIFGRPCRKFSVAYE